MYDDSAEDCPAQEAISDFFDRGDAVEKYLVSPAPSAQTRMKEACSRSRTPPRLSSPPGISVA
jgi:hypothetical protein